jgi:hypothetical protein
MIVGAMEDKGRFKGTATVSGKQKYVSRIKQSELEQFRHGDGRRPNELGVSGVEKSSICEQKTHKRSCKQEGTHLVIENDTRFSIHHL